MRRFLVSLVACACAIGWVSNAGAAPSAGTGPQARLRVSQTVNLVDGQFVRVHASGIRPGQDVRFLECRWTCSYWTPPYATADRYGRVDANVPLARYVAPSHDEWDQGDPAVDCAYDG